MAKGSGSTRYVGSSQASAANTTERNTVMATQPKVSLNQISVSDSSYRMSLGRAPRGTGNWAFSIGSREAFNDVTKAFWHNGSYTEAVKAAKKEAQKRGKTIVYVMS